MTHAMTRAVHQQIETLAAQQPDSPALYFCETELTYRELDQGANRIAHALVALGVGPESVVALLAQRSPQLVLGLLGILKAGAAYLPLDPSYPTERLHFMLQDANVTVLLGDTASVGAVQRPGRPVLLLD